MTKKENARYEAAERGSLFLETHDAELTTIVLYAVLKAKYGDIFAKITTARLKQFEQTGDITALKMALKSIMLNTVYKFMLRSSVQAFNLDKTDLYTSLNKPIYFLSQGSNNDAIGHCTDMLKIMTDNASTFTVLQPADLTDMDTAIENFTNILAKPKAKIKTKKAEGTDPIPGLLNDLDLIKEQIGKLILSYLSHLSHTWEVAIKVGQPTGIRHTSLAVRFLEAATLVPLAKIKVTITRGPNSIIKYSSVKGWVRLFNLDNGNYNITAEHETVETNTLTDIGIDNKRIVRLEVRLMKKKPIDPEENKGSFLITAVDEATGNPVHSLQLSIPILNLTLNSDPDAQFFADALPPTTYHATISGDNIQTKDITITILPNRQTDLTIPVQLNAS
jgi:hypothetical protein